MFGAACFANQGHSLLVGCRPIENFLPFLQDMIRVVLDVLLGILGLCELLLQICNCLLELVDLLA